MTVADLLKQDVAALVENEGGWIRGLVGCVPAKTIQVRHCVVRVNHQLYVGRQIGLLRKKLLGMLIKIGWRPGLDEKNVDFLACEVRAVLHKIVYLFDTVWALISGEAAKQHKHGCPFGTLLGEAHRVAGWRIEGKVGCFGADGGRLGNSRAHCQDNAKQREDVSKTTEHRPGFVAGSVKSGVHMFPLSV